MALSKILDPVKANGKGFVLIAGNFTGNGAANPTSIECKGLTATWVSTGVYDLVLPGSGSLDVRVWNLNVLSSSIRAANVVSITESTRTIRVKVSDLATPTVQDLSSSERLSFEFWVKNTTAP